MNESVNFSTDVMTASAEASATVARDERPSAMKR